MTDRTKPGHGALVSVGKAISRDRIKDDADERAVALTQERSAGGKFLPKVTEGQWEWVLERIEAGDIEANIAAELQIHQSTIRIKRERDPEFDRRYNIANETAFVTLAKNIQNVTRGVEGYSSGDVRRDELIAKYDLELAKRFASRVIGDKVQVDQRTVSINIQQDDTQW